MIRFEEKDNNRVGFHYSKCDGMSQHYNEVDKDWANLHVTPEMTAEELEKLAWANKDESKVDGITHWWGLG